MKIIESRVMRGPNYWSVHHKNLIVLKIDMGKPVSAGDQTALSEELEKSMPSLSGKQYAEAAPSNDIPQLISRVALELQAQANMPCDYERTEKINDQGLYNIIFSYQIEQAGLYAGQAAVAIMESLLRKEPVDIAPHIAELTRLRDKYALGPTSAYILREAERRGIPYKRFPGGSLVALGYGCKQKMLRTAVADSTSGLGIEIAGDKEETKQILAQANVPVPRGLLVSDEPELRESISEIRYPVVTKPLDGNQGRGVTTHIDHIDQAIFGFHIARKISDTVIVEEFIEGDDYRFLVINYKLVAVAKRTPAMVTGNGASTIRELIDETNLDPDRGHSGEHVLAPIVVNEITEKILSEKNLTLDSVLQEGEILYLKETANISAGGTATDVTDEVHPDNVFLAERIARLFKLDICGIDIMTKDVKVPLTRETGAIIEVNAGPGVRMHTNPQKGTPRDVASPIIDMLFPTYDAHRIPLVAVTGTNGKTTTTRLVAHLAKQAGYKAGYATTDGVYIQDHLLVQGDCTGPVSAQAVLSDPTIDFAVLECGRGGILRSGLGFDHCDVSIITNITDDHLGLKDIHTLDDMARVKGVVAKTTFAHGYAVLNADDDLVYSLRNELECHVALFSINADNERVLSHIKNGGLAALVEDGCLVIYDQHEKMVIDRLEQMPLTLGGKAQNMIKNILPAALAAYIQKIHIENIRIGLRLFIPSPEHTPGRMNLFQFKHAKLMVDYAHNVDGFSEIKKYLDTVEATSKIGIITVPGDRRDQDICAIGQLAGRMFNEVIIRHDRDLRGRTRKELEALLSEAIWSVEPEIRVRVIAEEFKAIEYALRHAPDGAFIFECADKVHEVLDYVKTLHAQEQASGQLA